MVIGFASMSIAQQAWCFSSLEKVFFQQKELFQHSKGVFSAPGVFSASKIGFFQHPKGIFSKVVPLGKGLKGKGKGKPLAN